MIDRVKKSWKNTLVSSDRSIMEVIRSIDESSLQIAMVVDANQKLLGIVTDGDVRRGILSRISLDDPVEKIMNKNPKVAKSSDSREAIDSFMREHSIIHLPVVDDTGMVIDLAVVENISDGTISTPIVLMVGGLGSRLKELTKDCPKPLLKVGEKPILERIIDSFADRGFKNFYLCVNYKSEMIEDYFGDGSSKRIGIEYLKEEKKLGTAGALSLLREKIREPFIVMNGDLLTNVNFESILDFHQESESAATMCVREYEFQVPYGVVRTDGDEITSLDEKPTHKFFVNAGIYVLNPEVLDFVPKQEYFDMTSLFEGLVKSNKATKVFPIHEYWLDIGQQADYRRANSEIDQI